MTIACVVDQRFSVPSIFDHSVSPEAQEISRIKRSEAEFDTSFYRGIVKNQIQDLLDIFNEAYTHNWDGYDALPADRSSLAYAIDFICQLSPFFPLPELSIDNDGEVAIEWDYGPRRIISIRIGRDGTLHYAGLEGYSSFYGIELFRENIPSTITSGIERIVRSSSNTLLD